jgi:hypothetical protein
MIFIPKVEFHIFSGMPADLPLAVRYTEPIPIVYGSHYSKGIGSPDEYFFDGL